MIETSLILIEGLSGSGKSTTGQHLCLHLRKLGHRVEWIYEHETPHPIYPQDMVRQALEGNASLSVFDEALENWRRFVARLQSENSSAIMDAALFQTAVGALLAMDAEPAVAVEHVRRVQEAIKHCGPLMIYFHQSDSRQAINRIRQIRGGGYDEYCVARLKNTPYGQRNNIVDMEGVLNFFELQQQAMDCAFGKLEITRLAIENSSREWEADWKRIADFLSIPPIESPHRKVEGAVDFAGTYRQADSGDALTIIEDGQHLFLADETRTRLLPGVNDTFYVEGMCIEIAFRRDELKSVIRAELTGKLPNLEKFWVRV